MNKLMSNIMIITHIDNDNEIIAQLAQYYQYTLHLTAYILSVIYMAIDQVPTYATSLCKVYVFWFYIWYAECHFHKHVHCCDVIMSAMASQITGVWIVYSTVYSDVDQRKHQSSASLAFVRGINRSPVNFPHKGPVVRKMYPFDDTTMLQT